ncbi:PPA1309 family protein [Knoellia sinensis]|uniref:PPA1309 family protein n=1 Tax=Knoellia sinensis TaxID=136100 RepID=UPI00056111B2|nr:PPA1309 family protein [Knoellia sinensis]
MTTASQPVTDPLSLAALDTERHVASAGWDQPPRLFALVSTADLVAREPQLAAGLTVSDQIDGALTAIEQEDLPTTDSIESLLGQIAWPDTVLGCAIVVERLVVPPDAERGLPRDRGAAMAALAEHPERRDVRLLAAATRDGRSICLLRQRDHDRDDRVATGSDIAPGLVAALRSTLTD